VERLLVEERRDPEPRLLDEEALDLIAGLGGGGRAEVRRPATRLMWPMPSASRSRMPRVELDLASEQLERPDRAQLGQLLVERHPREQVGDARVDRQGAIAIPGVDRRHQPFTAPDVSPPTS
jgi:hypothetical protein